MICLRPVGWGLLFLLPSLAGPAALPTAAHGAIHEQIAAVSDQIRQDPKNPWLYLKRGELHSYHSDWQAALADYDRAAELDPGLVGVDLRRGRTLLKAGQFGSAKVALDRFLASQPSLAEGRVLRARALVQLGQHEAGVADFNHAIAYLARLGRPNPDYYLERARVVGARGSEHAEEALRGLDEGIAQLGPLATLQLYAIELELARMQYDAALARLATLAAQSPRQEIWLVRRGEILEQAGRSVDARLAYEQALVALDTVRSRSRNTRARAELEEKVRAALRRLEVNKSPEVQP